MYQHIETEFGRPLSPIERETITFWLDDDKYSEEVILLALRETVLNQAYSLKYMDKILMTWEKKNLRSVEQVKRELNKRKQAKLSKASSPNFSDDLPTVPLYNWVYPEKNHEVGVE